MKTVTNSSTVTVHYKGTLNDGSVFDDSKARGDAIEVLMGTGRVIPGFESALIGMTEGQTKSITIAAAEAYGQRHEEAIQEIPRENFPPDFQAQPGSTVQGTSETGQPLMARVVEGNDTTVTLDFNHPLAGEDLTFDLEVLGVVNTDTTDETETSEDTTGETTTETETETSTTTDTVE